MPKPKKLTRTARLANKGLIHPPPWLPDNMMLEGLTGSFAYGCEDPKKADRDIVGIVIPQRQLFSPTLQDISRASVHNPKIRSIPGTRHRSKG